MRTWVDGAVVDSADARVSVFDHGLTVGDGVFETVKVIDGVPFALTRHLERLGRSAAGLALPAPDIAVVRRAIDETLAANAAELTAPMRLRVTLTGGVSPLGSDRGVAGPTLVVAVSPMAGWGATAKVVVVPWVRNERSATTGVKTTSYAENVVALAHAKTRGASEALFGNTVGALCEGTGSNVFVVVDGRVLTPPLSSGCLAGVTRALVLDWLGADGAAEAELPIEVLDEADEVFLTSSTRDVQPVHAVGERHLAGAPGPVTTKVMAAFAERAAADVDP